MQASGASNSPLQRGPKGPRSAIWKNSKNKWPTSCALSMTSRTSWQPSKTILTASTSALKCSCAARVSVRPQGQAGSLSATSAPPTTNLSRTLPLRQGPFHHKSGTLSTCRYTHQIHKHSQTSARHQACQCFCRKVCSWLRDTPLT